jgi:hypothetical protein
LKHSALTIALPSANNFKVNLKREIRAWTGYQAPVNVTINEKGETFYYYLTEAYPWNYKPQNSMSDRSRGTGAIMDGKGQKGISPYKNNQ